MIDRPVDYVAGRMPRSLKQRSDCADRELEGHRVSGLVYSMIAAKPQLESNSLFVVVRLYFSAFG